MRKKVGDISEFKNIVDVGPYSGLCKFVKIINKNDRAYTKYNNICTALILNCTDPSLIGEIYYFTEDDLVDIK